MTSHIPASSARLFPRSRVHGFGTHSASMDEARRAAADAGVADLEARR
jgi:hypothetical protein